MYGMMDGGSQLTVLVSQLGHVVCLLFFLCEATSCTLSISICLKDLCYQLNQASQN